MCVCGGGGGRERAGAGLTGRSSSVSRMCWGQQDWDAFGKATLMRNNMISFGKVEGEVKGKERDGGRVWWWWWCVDRWTACVHMHAD